MSQISLSRVIENEKTGSDWNNLCKLGAVAAWLQLACLLSYLAFLVFLKIEPEPSTAAGYFAMLQNEGLRGFLRLDFGTLILICLFPFVSMAIFSAFRNSRPGYAALAMLLVIMGTLLGLANHHTLSIIHLSDLHAAAADAEQQAQLLAAGEAVIAFNMWNSTAGLVAGVFMQGGFLFISFIMLRSKEFSKITAYSGILSNGLDFIHLFVAFFLPGLANTLLLIGGIFYLIWFPFLGRDLYRLGRGALKND
jgi:hypothetical protein